MNMQSHMAGMSRDAAWAVISAVLLLCPAIAFAQTSNRPSTTRYLTESDAKPQCVYMAVMSDAEIEEKFRALAEGVLSKKAQDKLISGIWSLEKCPSVSKLMALMKADVKKKAAHGKKTTKAKAKSKAKPKTKKR